MPVHWIDWSIVGCLVAALIWLTLATRKYTTSVADFLSANRMAGRYLITVATGLGGAISFVAIWEMIYNAGFPAQWWQLMSLPLGTFLAMTGFVTYRYRQTRAMTLAQLFEMRYSRRFRFAAGILAWVSGMINYGIFPAVTARVMIYFFGLPEVWHLGALSIPMFPTVMALYLSFALFIALSGGQITIMITDFLQGLFSLVAFAVLMLYMLSHVSWADLIAGLQMAPEGKSMINPFKTGRVTDFNVFYFLIGLFSAIYSYGSWQGGGGYKGAAKNPHEAKMAGMLAGWRGHAQSLCMLLIPLVAYAVLHLPKFSSIAQPIWEQINAIQDPSIRVQMTVPLFLSNFLPVGLVGLFAAVIVCTAISCDDTYMHSWGSIFIQDVVMPLRNRPLDAKKHLLWLRLSVVSVAIFGFIFSMLFPLKDFIYMFFMMTGAVYIAGAGAVVIGGLYWKRGTTAAAWTAMLVGSGLSLSGLTAQQIWPAHLAPALISRFPENAWLVAHAAKFPLNGAYIGFIAMLASSLSYVLVSLLGPRTDFDMDWLLHRGKYAVAQDVAKGSVQISNRRNLGQVLGLSHEFTRVDKVFFWATFAWSIGWWLVFIVGTVVNAFWKVPDADWSGFWAFKIWLTVVLAIIMVGWFFCGGLRDLQNLFRDLRQLKRDEHDDGTVEKRSDSAAANAKKF
jgi:SSS family solute:Na+ symporter